MIVSEKNNQFVNVAFFMLLVIGMFLRVFKLGIVPVGLNADEASIGYEAYSLLKTGADRWGIQLPPYFLSFGSGQNTLYAYLSIPFLYFFDLSQTSIRLLSAMLGLCTIPLVYYLAKILFKNKYMVLACVLVYLFDPYLFISSRWALEINILPFFAILSILIFTKVFEILQANIVLQNSHKILILASFPSLALIIYTYASAIFVVFPFIIFLLIFIRREIWKNKLIFVTSGVLFIIVLMPFILFILKNNILKSDLAIEQFLPFQIPKMLSNREQIFKDLGQNLAILKKNIIFVFSGFKEFDRTFNTTKFFNPHLFLLFCVLGFVYIGKLVFTKVQKNFAILFFWSLASLVPFLFFEMNLNRSIHLQAIIPILSSLGLFFVLENITELKYKKYFVFGFTGLFLIQSILFLGEYFYRFPGYDQFEKNFGPAIQVANQQKKPNEKIAITSSLVFNYLFAGFHTKYPPAMFHKNVIANFSHQNVDVHSFGHYYMLGDIANNGYYINADAFEKLKKEASFLAVLRNNESLSGYQNEGKSLIDTTLYTQNLMHSSDQWKVVRFSKK